MKLGQAGKMPARQRVGMRFLGFASKKREKCEHQDNGVQSRSVHDDVRFSELYSGLISQQVLILRDILRESSIHVIRAAGDVFGFAAGEEKRERRDFFRFAKARQRNWLDGLL